MYVSDTDVRQVLREISRKLSSKNNKAPTKQECSCHQRRKNNPGKPLEAKD